MTRRRAPRSRSASRAPPGWSRRPPAAAAARRRSRRSDRRRGRPARATRRALPECVRVREGDELGARLAHGAILGGDLATAAVADDARAGGRCELIGGVVGGVRGDDELEPVGRVVERAQIRDSPLDHRLLVVGGDDHADARGVGGTGDGAGRDRRPGARRERVADVRPHERGEARPEADDEDGHGAIVRGSGDGRRAALALRSAPAGRRCRRRGARR